MDPPPRDKLGGDPIEMAGLFEGDIAGVSQHDVARKKGTFKVSSYHIVFRFTPHGVHARILNILTMRRIPNSLQC